METPHFFKFRYGLGATYLKAKGTIEIGLSNTQTISYDIDNFWGTPYLSIIGGFSYQYKLFYIDISSYGVDVSNEGVDYKYAIFSVSFGYVYNF